MEEDLKNSKKENREEKVFTAPVKNNFKVKPITNKTMAILSIVLIMIIVFSFILLNKDGSDLKKYIVEERIEMAGVLTGMTEENTIVDGVKTTVTKIQLDDGNYGQEIIIHNKNKFYGYREAFCTTEAEIVVKVVGERREFYDGRVEYVNILQ